MEEVEVKYCIHCKYIKITVLDWIKRKMTRDIRMCTRRDSIRSMVNDTLVSNDVACDFERNHDCGKEAKYFIKRG